ncbi:hypothetical protein [Cellulomonas xylanilytica]|uniref:Aminoacyl-transfer RNA synthetases class-II family profile domain-containing protein n=1 Tax=Cellulomonas xylanilytica TaxID=233583 RepID=A0A510V7K4_9CELL|nr:hypothetical protein [Cellulomonas xylanilytica]GEK22852.1 hypothetical protein CXY01_33720 [Cellulomonas xylanilytica]
MSVMEPLLVTGDAEVRIDDALSRVRPFAGAEELRLSPLLPLGSATATHYVRSFPQHALVVSGAMGADPAFLLAPTACYAVFNHLGDRLLPRASVFTHKNVCFRNETTYRNGERQPSFLMREFIFLSTELGLVHEWIGQVVLDIPRLLADEFGVAAVVQKACDPFFDPKDLHLKFQESEDLKSEFVVDGLAVASVNLHLQAFARSCHLRSADGAPLYSACFGLGYDRLLSRSAAARVPAPSLAGGGRDTEG